MSVAHLNRIVSVFIDSYSYGQIRCLTNSIETDHSLVEHIKSQKQKKQIDGKFVNVTCHFHI